MSYGPAHGEARPSGAGGGDACARGRDDSRRSILSSSVQQVRSLLANFRLLEAAGACGLISKSETQTCNATMPPDWWEALAESARTYRSAVYSTGAQGFRAIDEWSRSEGSGSDDLVCERTRVCGEHRKWLCDVPGGQAYVAWLGAYMAVAEMDGERALTSLDRSAMILREFVHVPELEHEPSVYDFLQSAANALALFLPLPEHPVRDVQRFAFLPSPLRTGYGS